MGMSIRNRKYCRFTKEDYDKCLEGLKFNDYILSTVFDKDNRSKKYSVPSWEEVVTVLKSDESALVEGLRSRGVAWFPESVRYIGEPEDRIFGHNAGCRHFSKFFMNSFGAPKELFKTSVSKMELMDMPNNESGDNDDYCVMEEGFLATLILPIKFQEPFRVEPVDFFNFSAWSYYEENPYEISDCNYTLNYNLRPLFHTLVISVTAVEKWISDQVKKNRCEKEMGQLRALLEYEIEMENGPLKFESVERRRDENRQEYYVNPSGLPVENSSLEEYDKIGEKVVQIQKSRPDIDFFMWRLVLLEFMVGKSWKNGYAVGFS